MTDFQQLQLSVLPDGRRVAWREQGSGPSLIMLHGWSLSSVVFSEVAVFLAKHFRVLCPDLPGHGQSDRSSECSLDSFSRTISAWAKHLDITETALLGWSLGGQVAMQLTLQKRLDVKKLLLVATTPCFCRTGDWEFGLPLTQLKLLERNLGRAFEKTMADFFQLQFVGENLSQERYRQILKFVEQVGRMPEPAAVRETLAVLEITDLRDALAAIQVPTLVMHGDLDQIVPFAAGKFLAAKISTAQLCCITAVGHAPFFSCPEKSVSQWLKFLQSR